MNSLVYRAHHPQRRQRENLLVAVRIARPIPEGSLGGLLDEERQRRREIHHRQWRLMSGLSWIDQFDFVKCLNLRVVRLILIHSRARFIRTTKRGLQSAWFARKLRRSHTLENQFSGHEPRAPERLQVGAGALVFVDDAPPVTGLDDTSGSKPDWRQVKIDRLIHSSNLPAIPSVVERQAA